MAFRVEIAPQAFDDLDSIAAYIRDHSTFAVAEKWFNGMIDDIASLKEMPARCGVAPESEDIGQRFVSFSMAGEIVRTKSTTQSTTRRPRQAPCESFTCAMGPESRLAKTSFRISWTT